MKRKYATMGLLLVLSLSIMATTIANAALLSVTKVEGKYSVWSVGAPGLISIDSVYFEYRILDNKKEPQTTGELPKVYLTEYENNSTADEVVLIFEIKDLNDILDDLREDLPAGWKIEVTYTGVKFTDSAGEHTATGPAWRRRGGYI